MLAAIFISFIDDYWLLLFVVVGGGCGDFDGCGRGGLVAAALSYHLSNMIT